MLKINKLMTGVRLKEYRKEAGLSAQEIGDLLGIIRITTVYEWESGKSLPSYEHLAELCFIYKTNMENILVFNGEAVAFSGGIFCALCYV